MADFKLNIGSLYVVATPIGNLEDITLRAIKVLEEVDSIICEDTRHSAKLLKHYNISKPLISFHSHSSERAIDNIISKLESGESLALITDAGTPAISDPGTYLVAKLREQLPELPIIPIPGASALTAAVSVSGLGAAEFIFYGFLPRKKGRAKKLAEIAATNKTVVLYESPHRILKLIESLVELCPDKQCFIAREATKQYEQYILDSVLGIRNRLKNKDILEKGEFTIVLSQ